jgi:hypothetical protein
VSGGSGGHSLGDTVRAGWGHSVGKWWGEGDGLHRWGNTPTLEQSEGRGGRPEFALALPCLLGAPHKQSALGVMAGVGVPVRMDTSSCIPSLGLNWVRQ